MESDSGEWLTIRKLVIFTLVILALYLTLWTQYYCEYFPEAHRKYDKEFKPESRAGEAR